MIAAEMQYHPANSQREAMLKAAESLIISELLRARTQELAINSETEEELIEALIAAEVTFPEASDTECAHYYHANLQRFLSSPLLEVSHILLAAAPDDDAARVAAKERAEVLLNYLKAGENFAALARAESACPSKELGGNLGQISRGQTVPEFERQVFVANSGLLSRPIESRYGFHVVFIERKIDGAQLPYEAVKEKISNYLNEKVKNKAIAQYIHKLIANADIEGYDFGLSASPLMQ